MKRRLRSHDLITRFADYQLHELEHAPRTTQMYVRRLAYAERLTGKPIHLVTADDLRLLKRTCELSSESIKGIVVAVHQFHIWGALEGLWPQNGICLVRTPKVTSDTPRALPMAHAQALLAACHHPLEYRLIYLGLYAGLRIGESAVMSGEMWADGVLRFRGEKNGHIREVPVHPDLAKVQWKVLAWPPSYDSTLQRVKRRLAERTGVAFVSHQLRKTFATSLYDADTPDEVVRDLLGHSGSVTRLYAPVSSKKRLEAVARLAY